MNAVVLPPWKQGGQVYLPAIAALEIAHQIPTDLLARVAYQESSWIMAVINYLKRSSVGAMGMFQLMPRDFPGVGAGWQSDGAIAAAELVRLYRHFGDWQYSIAAYDFGQGNVDHWIASGGNLSSLPTETHNYVTHVFTDVPIFGSILSSGAVESVDA